MHVPTSSEKTAESSLAAVRPQRLLRLESLLKSGPAWSGDQLAEFFGVCRRTIFRDIQLLRQARVPVIFDVNRGGYRIVRQRVRHRPKIQVDELVALVLAVKYVGPLPASIAQPCERAIAKVMSAVAPEVRKQALAVLKPYSRVDERVLEEIPPPHSEQSPGQPRRNSKVAYRRGSMPASSQL